MAFILEDGTGIASANQYVDAAFVTAYLTDRGRETENLWSTIGSPDQDQAIVKATDYIEKRFSKQWRGNKLTQAQGLSWPRSDAFDDEGFEYDNAAVPVRLEEAVAEYTVRSISANLVSDPDAPAAGSSGVITRVKEKIGPLESDISYDDSASPGNPGAGAGLVSDSNIQQYPAADLLLQQLISGNTLFGRVARA